MMSPDFWHPSSSIFSIFYYYGSFIIFLLILWPPSPPHTHLKMVMLFMDSPFRQKITFSGCFSKFHHLLSPDAGTEDNGISTEPISLLLFPGLLPLTVSMINWRNPLSTEEKKLITFMLNNNVECESYPNLISHSKCGTKVIIEEFRGGRFSWNRNWDLGWIWAKWLTFLPS